MLRTHALESNQTDWTPIDRFEYTVVAFLEQFCHVFAAPVGTVQELKEMHSSLD